MNTLFAMQYAVQCGYFAVNVKPFTGSHYTVDVSGAKPTKTDNYRI